MLDLIIAGVIGGIVGGMFAAIALGIAVMAGPNAPEAGLNAPRCPRFAPKRGVQSQRQAGEEKGRIHPFNTCLRRKRQHPLPPLEARDEQALWNATHPEARTR